MFFLRLHKITITVTTIRKNNNTSVPQKKKKKQNKQNSRNQKKQQLQQNKNTKKITITIAIKKSDKCMTKIIIFLLTV